MKKILFLLLIPALSFGQWRKDPEKKDNAVRIANVTFQQAVRKLIDMSYRIDKLDSNYQTIQVNLTEYQTMHIRFDSAQSMIVTSELYIPGNMFAQHEPVLWWKSNFNRASWNVMMKYAGTFNNIEYAKL